MSRPRSDLLVLVVLGLLTPLAHAASLYVANNGLDGPGCGAKATPCRSIGQAIANAAVGDTIVVGPGRYGDVDGDGLLGGPGDENPAVFSPGCGCVLGIVKSVDVVSSDGAAVTVIDGSGVATAIQNVAVLNSDLRFGKPGKGFTVTPTGDTSPANTGIGIDGTDVRIAGNQVVGVGLAKGQVGIQTVVNDLETIVIEENQVLGWIRGIVALSRGKTVRKNVVALNTIGIVADVVTGNVATANGGGVLASTAAVGNGIYGNAPTGLGIGNDVPGTIEKNNFFGNGDDCGIRSQIAAVVAPNNYWGAASGPGADPADTACAPSSTLVPFATGPFRVRVRIRP